MRRVTDPYAELALPFARHYTTVRGIVREALVARQLAGHLPAEPGSVADVGGGAGSQAIRLARLGHEVTLLDPSERMLSMASEALKREPGEVRAMVRLVRGFGERAPEILGRGRFDVVCCHGVLMYVEAPEPLVRSLVAIARPGGVVSVLTKNAASLAMRPALEGRFGDALAAFDAPGDVGGLGVHTRAHLPADLWAWLSRAGAEQEALYGVRVFTDHVGERPPGDDIDAIVEAEWEAGRRDLYRQVARLVHVIARRS